MFLDRNIEVSASLDNGDFYKFLVSSAPTLGTEFAVEEVVVNTVPAISTAEPINAGYGTTKKFRTENGVVSWSFTTPILPYKINAASQCAEHFLWAYMLRGEALEGFPTDFELLRLQASPTFTLRVKEMVDGGGYELQNCVINSAQITIDVTGIMYIQWAGFATNLVEDSAMVEISDYSVVNRDHLESTSYLQGRYSTLSLGDINTDVILKEAAISIDLGYTPAIFRELNSNNSPIKFTRRAPTVTGSFAGYLDGDQKDLVDGIRSYSITNEQAMTINLGGITPGNSVSFTFPQVFLQNPSLTLEGYWSFSIPFDAQDISEYSDSNYNLFRVTYN